jgi:hypothetical protein
MEKRESVWFVGNTITYSKGGAPDILVASLLAGFVGHRLQISDFVKFQNTNADFPRLTSH